MSSCLSLLSELDDWVSVAIPDPLWGHVHLPPGLVRILDTPAFTRLIGIRQLGPVHWVYPGATHTRFSHSIGVFSLAFKVARQVLRSPEPDSTGLFTSQGIKAFLSAALCHDLGHFPFTHSLKELPLEDHETLTGRIIRTELRKALGDAGIDADLTAAIIDKDDPLDHPELAWYRNFLSGVLDPDKLDYLPRDSYFCGLPYGRQDTDHILGSLRFSPEHGLGVTEAGIRSIEHLLFSKYLLYKSVYWHPRVRSATAMVKKGVYEALGQGSIKADDLYGMTDQGLQEHFSGGDKDSGALVSRVFRGETLPILAEFPLTTLPEAESPLLDLASRARLENLLARELCQDSGLDLASCPVVIDLPEKVGFEVHMPVWTRGGVVDYPDTDTVFSPEVIHNFTGTLRFVRLMAPVGPQGPSFALRDEKELNAWFKERVRLWISG